MGRVELMNAAKTKTAGLYYWLRPDGHLQEVSTVGLIEVLYHIVRFYGKFQ